MAEADKSNIINLASGQAEPYKVCHRGIGTQVIVGHPSGSGMIAGASGPVPIAIPLTAACIGPRCRMWCEEQAECSEVIAAQNALELSNVIEAHGDQIADGFNLLLAELRAGMLLFTPPLGSTRVPQPRQQSHQVPKSKKVR